MEGKQGVNLVEPWRMGDAGDGDQTPPTHTSAMMPTPTHPQRSAAEEDERLQRVRQIISREFDVEILHKWREVRIIEDELDKAAQLRTLLEKLLLNGTISFSCQFSYISLFDRASVCGCSTCICDKPARLANVNTRWIKCHAQRPQQSKTPPSLQQQRRCPPSGRERTWTALRNVPRWECGEAQVSGVWCGQV